MSVHVFMKLQFDFIKLQCKLNLPLSCLTYTYFFCIIHNFFAILFNLYQIDLRINCSLCSIFEPVNLSIVKIHICLNQRRDSIF